MVRGRKDWGWSYFTPKGVMCHSCRRRINSKPGRGCWFPEHARYYERVLRLKKLNYPRVRESTKIYRPQTNWTYLDGKVRRCVDCDKLYGTKPGKNCKIQRHLESYQDMLGRKRKSGRPYNPNTNWTYIDKKRIRRCRSCNKRHTTKPGWGCDKIKHHENYGRILKRERNTYKHSD